MSQCVEKLSHDCGSSDGLQVFYSETEKAYTGYCFACGTYVHDPYGDAAYVPAWTPKSPEDVEAELAEVDELTTVTLHHRKLNASSLAHFGVKVALSEEDGVTPTATYFPYRKDGKRCGYKIKTLDKQQWGIGSLRDVEPFGWEEAKQSGSNRLFITEGEEDAVALYQAIRKYQAGTQWADSTPAVISLASGASSAKKTISKYASEFRSRFKEVVLAFDMDEPGRKAVKEATVLFPSATTIQLPSKDANEAVMEGRSKALAQAALFKSSRTKSSNLINGYSLLEAGLEQPQYGLSYPFDGLTELTRGIRFGETIYIGAGVKMGKSEMLNALVKHIIVDHNLPVMVAKFEEAPRITWKKVLGKCEGYIFHDPKIEIDQPAYYRAAEMVGDKLTMWHSKGGKKYWDELREDVVEAVDNGVKALFIDPITNLINGDDPSTADTFLKGLTQEVASMALDLDIAVFFFCHLKAPDSGPPHERGGKVYSSQFAGSRAMMRSCNYMFSIEGNKDPDLSPEERNIRKLVILEDREFGETGIIPLYWNDKTQLFTEIKTR